MWNFGQKAGGPGTATVTIPPAPALPPGQPPPGQLSPAQGWGPEQDYDDEPEHYVARPVRPIAQIATRVALWSAVMLGALGGITSMVTVAGGEEAPPEPEVDESIGVPAPVAGVAELAVERWLTASEDTASELDHLFVEMPELENAETEAIEVIDVKSVAGLRLEEGYWSVTVAARVVEIVGDVPPPPTTWFVEIGIVGDVEEGLAALTTPAVVPPPMLVDPPWKTSAGNVETPDADDRIASTVEGFLNALLAGKSDPGRYLAPRVDIPAVDPAPFVSVELQALSVEEIDEDEIRIWVLAELTTAADSVHVSGYEIKARRRIDRWEILSIWGAPAVEQVPEPEDEDDGTGTGTDNGANSGPLVPPGAGSTTTMDDGVIDETTVEDPPVEDDVTEDPPVDDQATSTTDLPGD